MIILGKQLSEKAGIMAKQIIDESKRKIEFNEAKTIKGCWLDLENSEKYIININHEFAKESYDFCILHELMHTVQIDKNYPRIYYNSEISNLDEETIKLLDSLVKDIFVNKYLLQCGVEIIKSPINNFWNEYCRIINKSVINDNDKGMMLICLISLKYVYMRKIDELFNITVDTCEIVDMYIKMSKTIEENSKDCYDSLKNIYEQFIKELKYLKIEYIK